MWIFPSQTWKTHFHISGLLIGSFGSSGEGALPRDDLRTGKAEPVHPGSRRRVRGAGGERHGSRGPLSQSDTGRPGLGTRRPWEVVHGAEAQY